MSITMIKVIGSLAYLIVGPLLGGLLAGLDRKVTARMQGRVGPPIRQPFYDVMKLFSKENATTSPTEGVYVVAYFLTVIASGVTFFSGGNFLLVVFLIALATLFFIMAAYSSRSPYAEVGAQREILQVMAYEPMLLLVAVGFYMATGSFDVTTISQMATPAIATLPVLFIGYVYILIIKLRKSPFDLSTSEHAHQELVKGVTTEMSGPTLAIVEVTHWYESILFLGWLALFIVCGSWWSILIAIVVVAVVYLIEILIDNNFARVKWQVALSTSWWFAFICGSLNLSLIPFIQYFFL